MNAARQAGIDELVQLAMRSTRAGLHDEAARAWQQVLAAAPDHPQALYFLGQRALRGGDASTARQMLQRAANANPKEPLILVYLAMALREQGDAKGEGLALEQAIRLDPYCYPAMFLHASLLERVGKRRQAASFYKTALKIAPSAEQLPPFLKGPAARAKEAVRENAAAFDAFVRERLGAVRGRHGDAPLARFDECKDILVGTAKAFVHEPTMLHFPQVPAIPFYDRSEFPWLRDVEASTDAIAEELASLLREESADFKPYVDHPEGAPLNQWAELNRSPRWSAYFLWRDGARQDAHCRRCPRTAAALEAAPLADVPGYAPAAFFSTLEPRTRIPPHTGATNTRLIVHLPLVVPEKCGFRVGNTTREWKRGEAWVFDDTIEHEAWNDSDELRVLLIFDIWNPYLSAAERELVCALLAAKREYEDG